MCVCVYVCVYVCVSEVVGWGEGEGERKGGVLHYTTHDHASVYISCAYVINTCTCTCMCKKYACTCRITGSYR